MTAHRRIPTDLKATAASLSAETSSRFSILTEGNDNAPIYSHETVQPDCEAIEAPDQ